MTLLTRNYHTHTFRCKHASGDCLDYAQAAAAAGMDVLGFSDHTPLPDDAWSSVRMPLDELDAYDKAMQVAADETDLTILRGMECEYRDIYHDFYADELLARRQYDYLIGAVHYIPTADTWGSVYSALHDDDDALKRYRDMVLQTIDSGLFHFIAHPDVFGVGLSRWSPTCEAVANEICAAAATANIPLELNGYGVRKKAVHDADTGGMRPPYPWKPFWQVASSYDVCVLFNSDAHRPEDVGEGEQALEAIRQEYGLRRIDLYDDVLRANKND